MPFLSTFGAASSRIFRLLKSIKPFSKVSNITNISPGRSIMGSSSFANRAVFVGGTTSNYATPDAAADSYDANLVKQTISGLPQPRLIFQVGLVGTYLVIGGGYWDYNGQARVDYYDSNLTTGTAASFSLGSYGHTVGTNSNYVAFFGIGNNNTGSSTYIDYYSTNLTKGTTYLQTNARGGGTICIGNNIVFGYGNGSQEIFNSNMARISTASYPVTITGMSNSASTGDYALYVVTIGTTVTTQAMNANLVRFTPSNKTGTSYYPDAIRPAIDGRVFFIGGDVNNTSYNSVDIYDNNLVKTIPTQLSQARGGGIAAAAVGNHMVIGGGTSSGGGYGPKISSTEVYSAV